jgi:hypothetical protein
MMLILQIAGGILLVLFILAVIVNAAENQRPRPAPAPTLALPPREPVPMKQRLRTLGWLVLGYVVLFLIALLAMSTARAEPSITVLKTKPVTNAGSGSGTINQAMPGLNTKTGTPPQGPWVKRENNLLISTPSGIKDPPPLPPSPPWRAY